VVGVAQATETLKASSAMTGVTRLLVPNSA